MKKLLLPSLSILILSICSLCAQITDADFANLFNKWNDALQTGKSEAVAALYSDEGVLLPTVSNDVKFGRDQIQQYFVHFLEYKPKGKILKRITKAFGDKAGVDSGVYEFELTDKDGKVNHVIARYTYIYEQINGQWLITVHHSSVMPNATEASAVEPEVENVYDL